MKNKFKLVGFSGMILIMIGWSRLAQATFYDVYSGMLKKQGDQYVLSKCGTVSTDFILKFANTGLKKRLPDLAHHRRVQLHVKGEVKLQNGHYNLMVHEITGMSFGTSCHLLDALD